MAKKSTSQKLARTEDVCIGAGFLLKKLAAQYGRDFGEGMNAQVRDCIRDCDQIAKSRAQREASAAAKVGQ